MRTPKDTGEQLLCWYTKCKRDLPWRKDKDPYRIWISEIMLQQTRVDTVIDYYLQFLQRFPNALVLAEAKEEEVLSVWKGLGYYSRARNLHKAAKSLAEKHGGTFPNTYEAVRLLPGIGDYTAGAIVSISFDQPYPAVDGNVLRVISRVEGLEEDIGTEKAKKKIRKIVSEMIPEGKAGDFNQSIMELGAMICVPLNPLCQQCPIYNECQAFVNRKQNDLPVKKKKDKMPEPLEYWVAVIQKNQSILMEYRRDVNLLGRMWGFPMVRKSPDIAKDVLFETRYKFKLKEAKNLGIVKHIFTHQVWEMEILEFSAVITNPVPIDLSWIALNELKDLPIPTAFQKVLKRIT